MKRGKELFFTEHWYNERDFSPAFCFGDIFEHKTTSERVVLKSFEPIHKVIVGYWKDSNVEKVIDFYDLKENYTNVGSVLDK